MKCDDRVGIVKLITAPHMIDQIIINDNAYFYRKSRAISKATIDKIFTEVSSTKKGRKNSFKQVKQIANVGSKTLYYSIYIFPYTHRPSFLKENVADFFEVKFSFLLIAEYDNYVVIYKNNVAGLKSIYKYVEQIDYDVISRLFVSDTTLFEKFNVSNMNTSDSALRNRIIEAIDVKGIISQLSASKQVVNGMRIDNGGRKTSLSLNTSRINNLTPRHPIQTYFEWAVSVCDRLNAFGYQESYLDIFAKPVDYEEYKDELVPICILLKFDKLKEEIELGLVEEIYLLDENDERVNDFNIWDLFENLSKSKAIEIEDEEYKVLNDIDTNMYLNFAEKSIRLRSNYFNRVKIKKGGNIEYKLSDYLNFRKDFIINFEETELIYTYGSLFRDQKLLGGIESFMSVFEPHPDLNTTNSEKGNFANGQTTFENNSIFNFIAETLAVNSECLICDDLNNEWADFISIEDGSIIFYHAKHDTSVMSASALQVIIGQAQKNFGNMEATRLMLESKRNTWDSTYNNDNAQTQIHRIRTRTLSIDQVIDLYEKAISLPHTVKKVYIVIDFLSKALLEENLGKLRRNEAFPSRPQALQILWFVSSLIAGGKEISIEIHIICKP